MECLKKILFDSDHRLFGIGSFLIGFIIGMSLAICNLGYKDIGWLTFLLLLIAINVVIGIPRFYIGRKIYGR